MEGSDDSGDEINDGEGMTEVRFVPDDKSKLQEMFQAMSTCQALHPDPEDAENVEEEQNEDQEDEFGKLNLRLRFRIKKISRIPQMMSFCLPITKHISVLLYEVCGISFSTLNFGAGCLYWAG